jgi:hypothetical protein
MDIIRTHSFPLHIEQFLEILDLSLELSDDFHVLTVEFHWLHFHHDLYSPQKYMSGTLYELQSVHSLVHVVQRR